MRFRGTWIQSYSLFCQWVVSGGSEDASYHLPKIPGRCVDVGPHLAPILVSAIMSNTISARAVTGAMKNGCSPLVGRRRPERDDETEYSTENSQQTVVDREILHFALSHDRDG